MPINKTFTIRNFPTSQGSVRLESPPGESLAEFFFRFMKRKEEKTGWRSGRLDRPDTKRPDQSRLEKPFISLLDALEETEFVNNRMEAELLLQALALEERHRMGVRHQNGGLKYWVTPSNTDADF